MKNVLQDQSYSMHVKSKLSSWDIPEIILLLCGNPPPKQPFWGGYKISNIFSNFVLNEIIQKERAIWLNFDLLVMFIWFLNTSRWKYWLSKKSYWPKLLKNGHFTENCVNAYEMHDQRCWVIVEVFLDPLLF